MRPHAPVILFGAFDRHNFGDLLFPHVAASLLVGESVLFAGLAERDLRPCGGHRVRCIAQLAAEWGEAPVNVIHIGGEILDCDAWEAAVMLLPPEEARCTVAQFDAYPRERLAWAKARLGLDALAPYCLPPGLFPGAVSVAYQAVGGTGLERRDQALRAEVLEKLRAADLVSVRDRHTRSQLEAAGVASRLMPDPAVMVAECFGARIARCAEQGEVAGVHRAFPDGYLAVQFSADFGDDATLDALAGGLREVARAQRLGIALFRAGAAPWHDALDCYERLAARLAPLPVHVFRSLGLWDICALIASSRAYVGSSLHGRILAMAFALPRASLCQPRQSGGVGKQAAFVATWEAPAFPGPLAPADLARGVHEALAMERACLREAARALVARYREGFGAIRAALR